MPSVDETTRVGETKVSDNNSTAVPSSFRSNQEIEPGDRIEWHLVDGLWVVRKVGGED